MLDRNIFITKNNVVQNVKNSSISSGWMNRSLIYCRIGLLHVNIRWILVKLEYIRAH